MAFRQNADVPQNRTRGYAFDSPDKLDLAKAAAWHQANATDNTATLRIGQRVIPPLIQTSTRWILFKVLADFTTADQTISGEAVFDSAKDTPDTDSMSIVNPECTFGSGSYIFEGTVDLIGVALYASHNQTWTCIQMCCEPPPPPLGYVPEP